MGNFDKDDNLGVSEEYEYQEVTRESILENIKSETKKTIDSVLSIPGILNINTIEGMNKVSKIWPLPELTKYIKLYYNDYHNLPNKWSWGDNEELWQMLLENLNVVLRELMANPEMIQVLKLRSKFTSITTLLWDIKRRYSSKIDSKVSKQLDELFKEKWIVIKYTLN